MDNTDEYTLAMLWTEGYFRGRSLALSGGGRAVVLDAGIWHPESGECREARVYVNGTERKGSVVFGYGPVAETPRPLSGPGEPVWNDDILWPRGAVLDRRNSFEEWVSAKPCGGEPGHRAVLQVCPAGYKRLKDPDGEYVPQVEVDAPLALKDYLGSLNYRGTPDECGSFMAGLGVLKQRSLFESLFSERLARKVDDVRHLWVKTDKDWNQTLYALMFKYVGGDRNRQMYMRLAQKVTYTMLSRESEVLENVEALLFGAAGLLEGNFKDDYVVLLKENFDYLRCKYNIVPFSRRLWQFQGLSLYNMPHLRIAELASLFSHAEFLFDNVIRSRRAGDVYRIFDAGASDYWTVHTDFDKSGPALTKRITERKAAVLGINVVVPLKFFYATETGNDAMRDEAVDLMDSLPAEDNRHIGRWSRYGVRPRSALEGQAMVQLSADYCDRNRCAVCRIGRSLIKSRFGSLNQIK